MISCMIFHATPRRSTKRNGGDSDVVDAGAIRLFAVDRIEAIDLGADGSGIAVRSNRRELSASIGRIEVLASLYF